ncbi:hypothetical protein Vretifemale_13169 [Volvox reticuliferus]|nr:hypothetical protein Vretifemale_13169 [Volvox reticuliferus]
MPDMEGSDHAPAWVDMELPDSELTHGSQLGSATPSLSSRTFFDTSRQVTLHAVLLRRPVSSGTVPTLAGRDTTATAAAASGRGDCTSTDKMPQAAAATAGVRRPVSCSETQVLKPDGRGGGGGGSRRRGSTAVSANGASQKKLTAFMRPRSAGECGPSRPVHFASGSVADDGDVGRVGGGGGDLVIARDVDLAAVEPGGGASGSSYYAETEGEWQLSSGMASSEAGGDMEDMEDILPYRRCHVRALELGSSQSEAAAEEVRPVRAELRGAAASAATGDGVAMETANMGAAAKVAEAAGGRSRALLAWRQIQSQMKPPRCSGHGEPCVIRTVRKKGDNNGRQFWCCARSDGLPPHGRCDFFQWARGRNQIAMAALQDAGPGPLVLTAGSSQGGRQQQQQQHCYHHHHHHHHHQAGGSEGVQGRQNGALTGDSGRRMMSTTLPSKRPRP